MLRPILCLSAIALVSFFGPAAAQTVRVTAEQEAFRQTPDGKRLGTVMKDAELRVVGRQGPWTQVEIEGWIWSPSVAPTDRAGFDLAVSARGGENLRDAPGGRIVARLLEGFLLQRVGQGSGWTRVRRTGWVWGPSLGPVSGVARTPTPAAAARPTPPPAAGAGDAADRVVVGAEAVSVRRSPEGDTSAVLRRGADLRVLERQGGWARIRLEGWVPASELEAIDPDSALADLSAADLQANPDQFVGRRVRWTVQFIALERAEPERTDFFEGEPFLLARAPDPSHGFVYLAVPEDLLPRVERLRGLERIDVLARVRTGRSALMGVPILDLLALY